MSHNKYNNFMEKLDTSEEFKRQLIDKINREEVKSESTKTKLKRKIISIISALSIFSVGGVVFAVTMPEEWKTSIKEFFGIISTENYEEIKIKKDETKFSNGYSLTLENYGIDAESLLISYDLKTAKEITLTYPFQEEADNYYYNNIKIIDKDTNKILFTNNAEDSSEEPKNTILINKINDTEYKIYEIYQLNSKNISNNSELSIDFNLMELQENAQGLVYDSLANFKFEYPIEKANINYDYQEYDIKNKKLKMKSKTIVSFDDETAKKILYGTVDLKISKIKNTDLTTKIHVTLGGDYHSNTYYTISIADKDNNLILDKDIQYLFGGTSQDIIIPKVDMSSQLKITLYEEQKVGMNSTKVLEKESIEIDLSELSNN